MKNQHDFFYYEWFLHNKNNIIGRKVDEVYNEYYKQSYEAGHRPYIKKTFTYEIEVLLWCEVKNNYFIKRR